MVLYLATSITFPLSYMIISTFSSGLQLILPHLYSHLMTLIIVSLRKLKQFSANSSNFIYVHYIYISYISSCNHTLYLSSYCWKCSIWSGFPGGSVVKNLPANAGDAGSIPGSRRSPREGNGNPIQHYCPATEESSMLQYMRSQRVW